MQRYEVRYEGRVQGVGFRYTAADIARRHDVAGYVRNEADGSVRLMLEGMPEAVEGFLNELGRAMDAHIQKRHVSPADATGEFGQPGEPGSFQIRY